MLCASYITEMADLRIILIGLSLISYALGTSYFLYPGIYPIVYFEDFRYEPTNTGYVLSYRTDTGIANRELGFIRDAPFGGNDDNNDDSNPDTLGSSREGRAKSKIPLKNRKVSPKLLQSLSG